MRVCNRHAGWSENFDDGCDRLVHGSIFAVVARRKGGQDDYVMYSFQNYIDRLALVLPELKCDQEPSTLGVASALIKWLSVHSSDRDCNAKRIETELGAWRTRKFDNSGTGSGISRRPSQ